MVKRVSGEIAKRILDVFGASPGKKLSIQDVAKRSGVSWESTKRHLETFAKLSILRETIEEGKSVYQKIRQTEMDTLFSIPLSEEDKVTIKRIYATIQKVWNESIKKPLSKTVVQKIAVEVVEKKFKKIPVGWYLYGQILLLPFEIDGTYDDHFKEKDIVQCVSDICNTYSKFDGTARIRRHQYEEKQNSLYLTKENLSYFLNCCDMTNPNIKNKIRCYLNEFAFSWERKERNADILAILEDFCSTTLFILRDSESDDLKMSCSAIIDAFNAVWSLIGTYEFYDSMTNYYDKEFLNDILAERLMVLKENAIEALEELRDHEPKYEFLDDEKYRKLKNLLGSAKELTPKEKKAKQEELEKLKQEKGEKVAQEILFKKFGL